MNEIYSYEEAFQANLDYFGGDELAAKVFLDKYALRNNEGKILEKTPEQMHRRLAKEFARIEKGKFKEPLSEDFIFSLFDKFKRIVPQGSPMFGIGNPYQYVSLGNCFVIDSPHDSLLSIGNTNIEIMQLTCRRAGVGWNISKLRPKGTGVKNAAKTTTGPVSFMEKFSNTIKLVGQFGRRGASLQCISVHHPDILDFIKAKRDLTKITGSNISVIFTDEFFKCLEKDIEVELRYPVCEEDAKEMKLLFPIISKKVKAKEIWNEFIRGTTDYAEPGAIFIDTVWKESTSYPYKQYGFKEIAPNPCGEQFLPKYTSCRLNLINLYGFVQNKFQKNSYFNFNEFKQNTEYLQRLADDLVDLEIECMNKIINKINCDPEPNHIKEPGLRLWKNIKENAIRDRRTGCGFTGLADCFASLGIKYGSNQSIEMAEEIMKQFKLAAYWSSVKMAKEIGSFPLYDYEFDKTSEFIKRLKKEDEKLYDEMKKYGRRNMTLLTIAPAGSVSCLTQTSSGLEPVFMLEYIRRKKGNPGDLNFKTDFIDKNDDHWMEFSVQHQGLKDWAKATNENDITKSPYFKTTAEEIDGYQRIKLQAILQKHCDNSISSTVNLPENITKEEVSDLYLNAYESGCKGLTVYRKNCRSAVLIDKKNSQSKFNGDAPKRPKYLLAHIHYLNFHKEKYAVIVGLYENLPYELFICPKFNWEEKFERGNLHKIKRGHYRLFDLDNNQICDNICEGFGSDEELVSRLVSLSLRHGINRKFLLEQIEKVDGNINNLGKIAGRVLKKYIKDGEKITGEECPQCNSKNYVRISGCKTCLDCGFSVCN